MCGARTDCCATHSELTHRATPYAAGSRAVPDSSSSVAVTTAEMMVAEAGSWPTPAFQAPLVVPVSMSAVSMVYVPPPHMSAEGNRRSVSVSVPMSVRIVAIVRVIVIRIIRPPVVGAAIKWHAASVESAAVKASSEASAVTSPPLWPPLKWPPPLKCPPPPPPPWPPPPWACAEFVIANAVAMMPLIAKVLIVFILVFVSMLQADEPVVAPLFSG